MNAKDYVAQCQVILDNHEDYERLDHDPSEEYRKDIEILLRRMLDNKEISQSTFNYLNRDHVRTARFYGLPKIHKGIQYWASDTRPPIRQIASANQSPTERPSQFCDHFLNPIMKLGPSHLLDTTDFIWKTHNLPPPPPGSILSRSGRRGTIPQYPFR